jgi:hypothetical protein
MKDQAAARRSYYLSLVGRQTQGQITKLNRPASGSRNRARLIYLHRK